VANREIEAILKISSKLGSMRALSTLQRELGKVDKQARMFNRSQSAIAGAGAKAFAATARFIAPMAAAYGIKRSVTEYAAVERRLNRIAINADLGRDAVQNMLKTVNSTSHDYAISQDQVIDGLETLVAAGRSADDAMSFLPSVTATAQAAGAEIADIATTADAVGNSFNITGDKMQHAFDILVSSGKQGKFELRDMARYLPSMAPAFAALGYKGEQGLSKLAAMLQTIRQRTGSAEEAATAAQNIFQKMESDQTVKKFAKFGVDLRSELAKARKEGRDLVDTFLDLSQKATKGDLSKIPQLFTDAQFQVGMRALLQGRQDMEGFQRALANVDGSTLHDLGQILDDNQSKIDRMASSWERVKTSFGSVVSNPVSDALDGVSNYLDYDEAITKGLTGRGLTETQQATWRARNWFDKDARGLAAFDGGWRSKEGKLAEKGKMADSPELPSQRQDAAAPEKAQPNTARSERPSRHKAFATLPDVAQVPGVRPDPAIVLPDLKYDRFIPPSPEGMRRQIAEDDHRALSAALGDSHPGGIRAAAMGYGDTDSLHDAEQPRVAGGDVGAAIKDGGDQAAQSISRAGVTLGDAGDQAGSAISAAASAIVSAGEQAAAAIRAAAKDLMRPIGSVAGRPALASGNPGRSMPDAGIAGGPR
jgi:TP901 family phage tail tape measure protein